MKIVCEQRCDEGIRTFKNEVVGTIRTIDSGGDKRVIENTSNVGYRIRKLTPKECWRLMGYTDEDFDRAKAVQERNGKYYKALYDQAGNSIAVPIFESIFRKIILQEVA